MRLAIALLVASLPAVQAATECPRPKPIYKVTKLSLNEVGISCTNGADPTGKKIGETLIISCGK